MFLSITATCTYLLWFASIVFAVAWPVSGGFSEMLCIYSNYPIKMVQASKLTLHFMHIFLWSKHHSSYIATIQIHANFSLILLVHSHTPTLQSLILTPGDFYFDIMSELFCIAFYLNHNISPYVFFSPLNYPDPQTSMIQYSQVTGFQGICAIF